MPDRPTHQNPAIPPTPAPWEAGTVGAPGHGSSARCMTAGDYWYERGAEGAGPTAPFGPRARQGAE
ncbi:hypothetical protein ACFV9D_33755 [Streptomyces sp. NPDC059875]|uniref:hypothetical protein n=1 Tax=unclassified Streptomyces TaxID=2593676 RepID=UPI0036581E59